MRPSGHKTLILSTDYNRPRPSILTTGHSLPALGTVHLAEPRIRDEQLTVMALDCHTQTGYNRTGPVFIFTTRDHFQEKSAPADLTFFSETIRKKMSLCFDFLYDVRCHKK